MQQENACERLQGKAPTSGGEDDALVSIIFSAASMEAFFNELPEMLALFPELLKDESPQVLTYVRLADEIETNKGSMKLKYLLSYSILSGRPCSKRGGSPYQDFSLLIEARNLLMLMKPSDFSGEANPNGTLPMKPTPRTMERFRAQNIPGSSELILPLSKVDSTQTPPLQIPFPLPWNYRIASPAAAHWVCNTAADVVDSILKVVPDGPHKPYLLEHCKTFKRLN